MDKTYNYKLLLFEKNLKNLIFWLREFLTVDSCLQTRSLLFFIIIFLEDVTFLLFCIRHSFSIISYFRLEFLAICLWLHPLLLIHHFKHLKPQFLHDLLHLKDVLLQHKFLFKVLTYIQFELFQRWVSLLLIVHLLLLELQLRVIVLKFLFQTVIFGL
jgi:hypothetical protein